MRCYRLTRASSKVGCWALKSKQIESVLGKSPKSVRLAGNGSASARPTLLVDPPPPTTCPAIVVCITCFVDLKGRCLADQLGPGL